jgi:DNA adenine methylase
MDERSDWREVEPVSPAAGWIGGKKQLAKRLCAIIESAPHRVYAEPFVGMGGVFFRRRKAARVEAINDADRDVANFFRILQRHYQQFMDTLKWQVASRAEFERLAAQSPELLTDLERAARFLYLQKLTFGGKVRGKSFGIDTHGPARFDLNRLGSVLEAVHERLGGVWIECADWRDFIARWDRPETLFYVDPPYYGTEGYYRAAFPRADHEALAALLSGLKGRFVLTMNDSKETRAIYRATGGRIETAELTYTAAGGRGAKRAGEIIVRRL